MSLSTLEVLRTAEARLSDPDVTYTHMSWAFCTCGQIYAAAVSDGSRFSMEREPPEPYVTVIRETAEALGQTRPGGDWGADSVMVSLAVAMAGASLNPGDRTLALGVVRKAIAKLEAMEEADRLAVLDQAREVVDAVAVDPSAVSA